ncbi:SPRY domain-containing SOCS box protein 3 isoform X1 [Hydra vulgaris]|uniref:SPRY domain-containing SOCS box protein 3 n=2 Tax=Hydra vulgaris TaxID=6087 RepID=T2MBB6_HYDVU|nr:SPRY domain-containing SOCS box protein 3 isoform X1 [Hydra vulgaris]
MSGNGDIPSRKISNRRGFIREEQNERNVEHDHSNRGHRHLLADIFAQGRRHIQSRRRSQDIEEISKPTGTFGNDDEEEEEDEFNEADFCWVWEEECKSNDVVFQNNNSEVYFHPDYSCGTAAVRGKNQFQEGEEHYWEIKLSSAVYGTDMMVGVGCDGMDLNKYKSQFCSIIGKESNSWGISYFGTVHHNGKTREFTKKFERGSVIGCHLDLWKGTLSFYKNGEPLGIAFEGLLGKKLYPMISSTAARTKMKLVCSYKINFSLQYLCCKEISKNISSSSEALADLPLPSGLKRYLGFRMDWVFRLHKLQPSSSGMGPSRKRVKRKDDQIEQRLLMNELMQNVKLDNY